MQLASSYDWLDSTSGASDAPTILRPRPRPRPRRGAAFVVVLLVVATALIGAGVRFRRSTFVGTVHQASPPPETTATPAATALPLETKAAPTTAETAVSASRPRAKNKRRARAESAHRVLERLQRAQLERAGTTAGIPKEM